MLETGQDARSAAIMLTIRATGMPRQQALIHGPIRGDGR
jgi:hypothetical protein